GEAIAGTPEYMSPEQAAGTELTEPTDWYSVGTILYEALTERLPFVGPRIRMLCDKQEHDPPAPTSVLADVPEDLSRLAMELMSRDPAARPKGARLLDRLGAPRATVTSARTSNPATSHAQLFGRESHLASLVAAFTNVVSGRPAIVHVRGQSGMGKSTLVRRAIEVMTSEHDDRVVVLSGRCYEQESVPYKAVDSVIDSLSRYLRTLKRERAAELVPSNIHALARLFPVLRRVEAIATAPRRGVEISDPHELRRRAFGALRDTLTRIAERSPLVVWIDDLQWGDVDSGMLLGELLRPPDPPPFLLIVSYRTEADVDVGCLAALRRVEGAAGGVEAQTIEVAALADEDAKRLAAGLLATPTLDDSLESIVRESAGNPFLLAELVRYQQSGAGLRRSKSGRIHLEDVLSARLSEFSEEARLLLELVAVAGRPIAIEVAIVAAELSPSAARTATAQLRAAQLVRTARVREQDGLDTFHDRIRETVIRLLEHVTLVQRHARLIGAIEASRTPDPEALAVHCIGAGEQARAGDFAERAGEQAVATLAFDRAAEWFRKAIEWRSLNVADERLARTRLAEALSSAGRGAEAGREFVRAADGLGGTESADLKRRAAEEFMTSGCLDQGIAVAGEVLHSVGASYPSSQLTATLLFLLASALVRIRGYGFRERSEGSIPADELRRIDTFYALNIGLALTDSLRARYFAKRTLISALRVGELQRVAIALICECGNVSVGGGLRAEARVRSIETRLEPMRIALASAKVDALIPFGKGWTRYFFGRFSEASELLNDALGRLRGFVDEGVWWQDTARVFLSSCLWYLGRVRELDARVCDDREDAERRGDIYMSGAARNGYANALWLVADRPQEAIREATDVFERWPQIANDIQRYYALVACAQADLYCGDGRSAYRRALTAWPKMRRAMLLRMPLLRAVMMHLRARSALAASFEARTDRPTRRDAERCIRTLRRESFPCARAMSESLAASLAYFDGHRDEALRLYASAATLFEAQSMALYAAACRYRQGQLLGGEAGGALVEKAEAFMRQETIKNPARMVDMLVPVAVAKGDARLTA
ncbi:MAG: AAA family ATPase, partial [Polyangiales bacterium]